MSGSSSQAETQLRRELGLFDLVLFNLTAILSIRWFATAARTGPSSLTLWVLAALLFFVPQAIAVVHLSARYPEEGGIYRWTRHAFGDFHGFLCGWCYWASTLVYYPSLLIFAAGALAYAGGAATAGLGDQRWFSLMAAMALLWIGIGANVVGLRVGKWVQNVGGVATWLPATLLIVLGALVWWRSGSANPMTAAALAPAWELDTLGFWSTIAFAFAGLELAPVMSGEIRDPRRNIPRAIYLAGAVVAIIYVAGTAAVLAVLPASDVNVVTGTLQTIDAVVRRAGAGSISQLVGMLLVLATLGGTGAWLAGSARIPFVAGLDRFLPAAFGRVHPRWHTPHIAILVQGLLASVFMVLALAGGTIAETYLLLAQLTIIVNFIPYCYLFLSALRLRNALPVNGSPQGGPTVPGGKLNVWFAGVAGFGVTLLAILLSLAPSSEVTNVWLYELKLLGGTAAFLGGGLLLYLRRR